MENFNQVYIKFKDEKLNEKIQELNECYFYNQRAFAKVCYKVYDIYKYCKGNYYDVEEQGYKKKVSYNSTQILALFGFDRKSVSRFINCFKLFITASCINDAEVSPMFSQFSPGKLYEMLPLSYQMLETAVVKGVIRPTMTSKEIRNIVKSLAGKDNFDNLVSEDMEKLEKPTVEEQELPEAFDPKVSHTYEYFKVFSKEELINCLFACEDLIKKLLKKK